MSWLEAILDPGPLVRGVQTSEQPSPQMGLALLLDNRLPFYQAMATKGHWPALGERADPRADAPRRLLSAVGRHLTGSEDPRADYQRLSRSRNTELSCVALVLLSFAHSDAGEPEQAVRMLKSRISARREATEQGLLLLQLGLRQAEAGYLREAIATTEAAAQVIRKAKPAQWRPALAALAAYNKLAFERRIRLLPTLPRDLPLRSTITALARNDAILADGLSEFLNTSFERSLASPYAQTVTWRSEDPAEARLRGTLIRAEILGDWEEMRQVRRLLGRYLVLSRLGTSAGVPPAALELMRRAGDDKGLQSATRTIAQIGSPAALRAATASLLSRGELVDAEPVASMRLLEGSADLLDPADADTAAREIMADAEKFAAHWNVAPDALAALVASSSEAMQSQAARFVRSMFDAPNSALVQNLTRVVASIRWDEVDDAERQAWLSEIETAFGSGTDAHFLSLSAIVELVGPNPDEIKQFVKQRFTQAPSLDLLTLVLNTSSGLPSWARKPAWEIVSKALEQTRASAHSGVHGIGTLDVGDLATAVLLNDRGNKAGWSELGDYLLDPTTRIVSKQRAFDRLARAKQLPATIRDRLRSSLADLNGFALELDGTPEGFTAAKLRLASRIGGLGIDEMLTQLVSLSASVNAYGRIEAATTLPLVRRRLTPAVVTAIALMLARDPDPNVRGRAARSLAQLQGIADDAVDASVRSRLSELLDEEGTVVPANAAVGLHEFTLTGGTIDDVLLGIAARLARHHMSHRVRRAAKDLVDAANSRSAQRTQR